MHTNLAFSYVDPRTLRKNAWNPNEMSPEAETKLRNSLKQNGHIRPILVREVADGEMEIVGGEHRVDISIELGHTEIPIINLGPISDLAAKKALLLDNSRYGEDEASKLSQLLEDIGTPDDLAEWTTLTEDDLNSLMAVREVDLAALDELDELGLIDDDEFEMPKKDVQTHQTMKFKVDVENAEHVKDAIEAIIHEQGIDDSDAAVRSGEALMWLVRDYLQADSEIDEMDKLELIDDLD